MKRTIIARRAIREFLNPDRLRDSRKAKKFTPRAIDRKLAALDPAPIFHTDPRHHQKVCFLLGQRRKRYLFLLDMGLGKALPLDEIVITPEGKSRMKDLRVGDEVIGADGKPTKITGIFPQGRKKVYKVRFSDGSSVRCCDEHLWRVFSAVQKSRGQPGRILPLSEIRQDLFERSGNARHYIPMTLPVHFRNERKLPIHPYILGVLLGDGCLGQGPGFSMGKGKKFVFDKVLKLLPPGHRISTSGETIHRICAETRGERNEILEAIRELELFGKVAGTKRIPDRYLRATITERIDLLQGLMDTDGYASALGTSQYTTASEKLARGVIELIQSLGGVARMNDSYLQGKTYFTLTINLPEGVEAFSLPRKLERCKRRPRKYFPSRAIVAVDYVGEEECQCISIEAPDGLFLTRDYIVTHNTKVILDLFNYAHQTGERPRMLVLVPNSSNVEQWADQVRTHTPDRTVIGVNAVGAAERMLQIESEAEIVVITYAGFLALVCKGKIQKDGKMKGWALDPTKLSRMKKRFNFLCFDESTAFKNHRSLTFRACRAMSWAANYAYALTGTPFGKDPQDLWSQFYVIDKGDALGETLTLFRAALFTETEGFWKTEYVFDKGKKRDLHRLLRHSSIRYKETDCDDLPQKIYTKVPVIFPEETWRYYDRLVKELSDAQKTKAFRVMENAFIRMRQLTAGYLAVKGPEGDRVEIQFKTSPKVDALLGLLEQIPPEEKVVVFNEYIKSGDLICAALKKEKIKHVRLYSGTKGDKGATVRKFLNDPSARVMVSSSAGAFGGNWQVARYVIFFESPVSPILRKQEEKRCHRIGQTRTVYYYDLAVRGSVDEKILRSLREGEDLFQSLVEGRGRDLSRSGD